MMTCDDAVDALWRHIEGDDGERDVTALDDHLGRCRRCCGEAEFAALLRQLWIRTAGDSLPDAVQDRFERTLAALAEST